MVPVKAALPSKFKAPSSKFINDPVVSNEKNCVILVSSSLNLNCNSELSTEF